MEIRQFKYFIGIVDCGSLSRAAQALYVAQSALSKQVADLEQELGTKLLERSRVGVKPTEAGRIFYQYSHAILKQLDDVRSAVQSAEGNLTGKVAVALPQSMSNALALPLSMAARQKIPGINVNLNEELTGNLLDQLQRGRVDFALFTDNAPLESLMFRRIAKEQLYLVSPADAQLTDCDAPLALSQLQYLPLVLSNKANDHCLRSLVDAALEQAQMPQTVAVAEVNSVHILKSAVMAGMGHTILPYAPVQREVQQGQLKVYPLGSGIYRNLVVCASKAFPLTRPKLAALGVLVDVVNQLCSEHSWHGTESLISDYDYDAVQYAGIEFFEPN